MDQTHSFAFVFPGQGSQSVAMMAAYGDNAVIRETFAEASSILQEDLWAMAAEGPAEKLAATVNTQPLMLTAGVAVFRAWRAQGGDMPAWVAGHSLGEYTALVAAGALSFADALPLVRYRAEVMQDAVPVGEGAMAALLGLALDDVAAVCDEAADSGVVAPANLNAPGQIVIAGAKAAVERAIGLARSRGARRAMQLPVSAPFHCELMRPAAEKLQRYLADTTISIPQVPVINNVDVGVCQAADAIRDALVRQVCGSVRWIETVQFIEKSGAKWMIECGPGKVLQGMNRRITASAQCASLHDKDSLETVMAQVGEN